MAYVVYISLLGYKFLGNGPLSFEVLSVFQRNPQSPHGLHWEFKLEWVILSPYPPFLLSPQFFVNGTKILLTSIFPNLKVNKLSLLP